MFIIFISSLAAMFQVLLINRWRGFRREKWLLYFQKNTGMALRLLSDRPSHNCKNVSVHSYSVVLQLRRYTMDWQMYWLWPHCKHDNSHVKWYRGSYKGPWYPTNKSTILSSPSVGIQAYSWENPIRQHCWNVEKCTKVTWSTLN